MSDSRGVRSDRHSGSNRRGRSGMGAPAQVVTTIGNRAARHTCHATGCEVRVPPKMFMCRQHWFSLPKSMRDEIWSTYRYNQENRMDPSDEYLEVALRCVRFIEAKEGR